MGISHLRRDAGQMASPEGEEESAPGLTAVQSFTIGTDIAEEADEGAE
jgi:hypothetical protein